ncbi:MAG: branched-chain amino acid ABC transporter permease, partial [Oscillospiraceae bacterium]|nr:branched-chain amino acid ABC transporter permease [Oscillospiraceae bacterium]
SVLPASLTNAMGIMLYGMFIAIFVPTAKSSKEMLAVVTLAAALSLLLSFCAPFISGGFAIIIAAVAASMVCAAVFPGEKEEDKE